MRRLPERHRLPSGSLSYNWIWKPVPHLVGHASPEGSVCLFFQDVLPRQRRVCYSFFMNPKPKHPPRLTPFQKFANPIWFVTFGTHNRKPILANTSIHAAFRSFAEKQSSCGMAIGEYVIMPDHIHLFLRLAPEYRLGATIGFLKKALSKELKNNGHTLPHWQPAFFDHMLRSAESYTEKWAYVHRNPVRAGWVENPDDWPYSGQIVPLRF